MANIFLLARTSVILQHSRKYKWNFIQHWFNFNFSFHYSVEKISACIENITNEKISDPIALFKSPDKVYSLGCHREFIIVGSTGTVSGFEVSSSGAIGKKSWTIQLPISTESCDMSEVNDLWIDSENDCLYAACGDSNVYVCSLEDGSFIRKLSGHKDYIHSVNGQ